MATKEDYNAFLETVRKQTGLNLLVPDEFGFISVLVQDEYNTHLQFIESTGKILLFVEILSLPKDAGKAVYRDLLAGMLFGVDSAGGFFSLEPETETVIYNYLFDFDKVAADPNVFISTFEDIFTLMDVWKDRIREKLSSQDGEESAEPINPDNIQSNSREFIIQA